MVASFRAYVSDMGRLAVFGGNSLSAGPDICLSRGMTRFLIALFVAATMAAVACSGGSPTSPTTGGATTGGATIAGTVVSDAGSTSAGTGAAVLTVGVSGTSLSTAVDSVGTFRLGGVPAGDVQLTFSGAGAPSTISLTNVAANEVIELQIALARGTATVVNQVRGGGQDKYSCVIAAIAGITRSTSARMRKRPTGLTVTRGLVSQCRRIRRRCLTAVAI